MYTLSVVLPPLAQLVTACGSILSASCPRHEPMLPIPSLHCRPYLARDRSTFSHSDAYTRLPSLGLLIITTASADVSGVASTELRCSVFRFSTTHHCERSKWLDAASSLRRLRTSCPCLWAKESVSRAQHVAQEARCQRNAICTPCYDAHRRTSQTMVFVLSDEAKRFEVARVRVCLHS